MTRILPVVLILTATAPVAASPDYPRAIEQQRHRLAEMPTAAAWNDLGALLLLAGNREEATSAFSAALDLDPDSFEALYNLGVLELDQDPNRSRRLLRSALKQAEDGWTHYRLAQALDRLHRERAAIKHYARAFELDRSLLDPAINPEIVANRLAMRSLLRARTQSEAVRPSPRFVDTGALRDLLLSAKPTSPSAEAAGADQPAPPQGAGPPEEEAPALPPTTQ